MSADRPLAIPRSRDLRGSLFIPALSRLLSDPAELPLDDSADSIRVRLDEAIRLVEKRCDELRVAAARARRWSGILLGGCFLLVIIGLLVRHSDRRAIGLAISVASVLAGLVLARSASRRSFDLACLESLRSRYRPLLQGCETVEDLRELSERIGSEMARVAGGEGEETGL